MSYNEIEELRIGLLKLLPHLFGKSKLYKISNFYSTLLDTNDNYLIEAYSLDFIQDYIAELKHFSPLYQSPQKTEQLLKQLNILKSIFTLKQFEKEFEDVIYDVSNSLNKLKEVLDGNRNSSLIRNFSFPLIESLQHSIDEGTFGTIESVCIKISHAKKQNKFVFVPSDKKVEERLLNQAKISFDLALNYFQNKKHKFHKYHEILIYFENLSASYEGESLGVVLTVGFIEQLSILYNLPYLTHIKNNITTTGGVDQAGIILPVSKEVIEKKIEIVFYSDIDSFVIPKEDENYGRQKLNSLQILYPNRKLNLIAIEDIKDIVNRRNLVDIKKQSPIARASKSIQKNWIAVSLSLIIFLIIGFIWIKDFDDNPAIVWFDYDTFYFGNKSRHILFSKKLDSPLPKGFNQPRIFTQFVDINSDGENEILFTNHSKFGNDIEQRFLACYNNKGETLWEYQFKDSIYSEREDLYPPFDYQLIDTLTQQGKKLIYLIANNRYSYPGAIISVDVKTGQLVGNVFWNSGHFVDALFVGNSLNEKTLISAGINNGFNQIFLLLIKLNDLKGQAITSKDYLLKNIPIAKHDKYFLLPKSDLNRLYIRYNLIVNIQHSQKDSIITMSTCETDVPYRAGFLIQYNYCKNDFRIYIQDGFSLLRDSLVKKGVLNYPLTDTREYRAILKNQIEYWNGKKFISQTNNW